MRKIIFFIFFFSNLQARTVYDYETNIFFKEIIESISKVNNFNKNVSFIVILDDKPNAFVTENNNIIVAINIPLDGLLDMNDIEFYICDKKIIINKDKLNLKKNQTVIIEEMGIPKISQSNIYNVTKLSNLIVNVSISNF